MGKEYPEKTWFDKPPDTQEKAVAQRNGLFSPGMITKQCAGLMAPSLPISAHWRESAFLFVIPAKAGIQYVHW